MVGEFMRIAGIYKVLYNPKYKGSYNIPSGVVREKTFRQNMVMRRRRENKFQINFWKKLNRVHDKFIPVELFKKVVMLLYEIKTIQTDLLADKLEGSCKRSV